MPTYEYSCSACGNSWEEIQKITEAPVEVCPKCSKKAAQRQISGGNFILKGGGWYADLYSSPKPGGGKKEPDAKSETKSESSSSSSSSSSSASSTPAKKD
jgi:putative FmdB family regulatory protein